MNSLLTALILIGFGTTTTIPDNDYTLEFSNGTIARISVSIVSIKSGVVLLDESTDKNWGIDVDRESEKFLGITDESEEVGMSFAAYDSKSFINTILVQNGDRIIKWKFDNSVKVSGDMTDVVEYHIDNKTPIVYSEYSDGKWASSPVNVIAFNVTEYK